MIGYDFDKTIYKGDSSTDFFFYMILHRPYLLLFTPWFLVAFALYGMKILSKKRFKESVFFFVPWHSNIDKLVNKFWAKNANKLVKWYPPQKNTEEDIIVSASLSFIIKPVIEMLNIKYFLATNYNVKTGRIYGENCYGEAKVREMKRVYPKAKLEAFYSDSLSDLPMMLISDKAYLVKGENVTEINAQEIQEKLEQKNEK